MANPEHLEILKQGVRIWNNWRKENPKIIPDLSNIAIFGEKGRICTTEIESYEHREKLISEFLRSSKGAALMNINLSQTNLNSSILIKAHHTSTTFRNANLSKSHLGEANLIGANLSKVQLYGANLIDSYFRGSDLRGTRLSDTKLQGADFSYAIVDGETLIAGPTDTDKRIAQVNQDTNFEGVGLDSMRIDPGIKQLLEYNIRRKKWERWYKDENVPIKTGKWIFSNPSLRKIINSFLKCLTRKFWQISDYGLSTKTIILKFFKWAAIFALVYYMAGLLAYFDVINNGFVSELFETVDGQIVNPVLAIFRAIYFSIVTMTTLGFGDMYADCHSYLGHVLLTIQVLMGYMFLGALVTRFAVLFTAGGPAAKFTELTKEEKTQS